MCIRYDVAPGNLEEEPAGLIEVFPGYEAPILVPEGPEKRLVAQRATWGLQPSWSHDPKFGRKYAYNARAETIAEKPTFRHAFRERRCIVPATAFYERKAGRWVRLAPADAGALAIAGLFEPPNDLLETSSFTMVTTVPNALIGDVRDRMPVLLDPEGVELWLSSLAKPGDLTRLLVPCPDEWLTMEDAGPISRKPKAGKDDEPRLF